MTAPSSHHAIETDDRLLRRTLRTVGVLLIACVVFVGVLSLVAVLVTNKAMGAAATSAEAKSSNEAKKPLSI